MKRRPSIRHRIPRPIRKAVDARRVTSRKGEWNRWDWIVASLDSIAAWISLKIAAAVALVLEILSASSDSLLSALEKIPREGKPEWFPFVVAILTGILVLIRRRTKGPNDNCKESTDEPL